MKKCLAICIDNLKQIALTSEVNNKHAACIIVKNSIFINSVNEYNTIEINKNVVFHATIHAEIGAIKKCINLIKNKKLYGMIDLIVIRVNETGELKNSKPCKNCVEAMKKIGIRRVFYSDDDVNQNIKNEYLSDIITSHVSSANRRMTKILV